MLLSHNLQGRYDQNCLMKNSPEFEYPIQPDCKSVMEPQVKSRDELLCNPAISLHKINPHEQQTSFQNSGSYTNTIRQHSIFSEISLEQLKFRMPTYLIEQFVYLLIVLSLILLPIQITFFSSQLVLLHIIITIFRMTEYLSRKRHSKLKADLWMFVFQTMITLFCLLVINMQVSPLYSCLGFIIYVISYTAIIQIIYQKIRRLLICLMPQCSIILLIIMRILFITHFLNCYVCQCLLNNQEESDEINYLEGYYITLCLIANIPLVKITTNMQLVTIFSYFYIIYLLLNLNQEKNDFISYFLEKQEISIQMRFKIFDELKTRQCKKISKHFSTNLINSINREQYQQFIKSNFETYDSFEQIASICEVVEFNQGSKIIELNKQDDCSLYFILKGEIKVILNKYQFKTLSEGSTFGEISFYTQQGRTATVICATNCSILKLSRAMFLNLLQNKDLERFHLIKDQILYSQQLPQQIKCYNCEEITHVILNCPHIQYSIQNEKIIELYNQQIVQTRAYYLRNSRKNVRILLNSQHQEQFKLKLQKILTSTSISSEYWSNPDQYKFHRDDFVSGSYNDPISPSGNGDQLFGEQYGTIQGMLLSSDRVFSLQEVQRHNRIIQEEESSYSSNEEQQEEAQGLHRPKYILKKKIGLKERTQSLSKEPVSDSSLNLSPIFKREQSNPSANLTKIPTKKSTHLKSQSSYPVKTESGFRSGFSSFQVFSENQVISGNFGKDDIDQMHIFELYYPQYNYDKILVDHSL